MLVPIDVKYCVIFINLITHIRLFWYVAGVMSFSERFGRFFILNKTDLRLEEIWWSELLAIICSYTNNINTNECVAYINIYV